MKLKDLNISRVQIKQALSVQANCTLTIKNEVHFIVQVLSDEGVGVFNIYFSPKGKCRFVCSEQRKEQKQLALKFAMKLVNDINMGVAA